MTRAFTIWIAALALGLATILLIEHREPNAGLPLVHADFPICITIRPTPLLRTPNGRVGFRQGVRSNDKGWS